MTPLLFKTEQTETETGFLLSQYVVLFFQYKKTSNLLLPFFVGLSWPFVYVCICPVSSQEQCSLTFLPFRGNCNTLTDHWELYSRVGRPSLSTCRLQNCYALSTRQFLVFFQCICVKWHTDIHKRASSNTLYVSMVGTCSLFRMFAPNS